MVSKAREHIRDREIRKGRRGLAALQVDCGLADEEAGKLGTSTNDRALERVLIPANAPPRPMPASHSLAPFSPSRLPWQRLAALALGSALLLGLAPLGGCEPRTDRPSDLRLLYTATLQGYIEPCGCTKGKTGGIDRVATAVRNHTENHPGSLFVDGGDLFSDRLRMDDKLREQATIKADSMFSMWSELGCAAMALGDFDLALGVEALQDLSARHSIPILCANLVDGNGERPFPGSVIVERNGLRIGIFGLLNNKLNEAFSKDDKPKLHQVLKRVREMGYDLRPWQAVADEMIVELADETDVILCASHLGFVASQRLAESHPELTLVFGGHTDNQPLPYEVVAGTPVTSSEIKGARINRVDLWLDEDYLASGGTAPLTDVSKWIVPRIAYDITARGAVMIEGRQQTLGNAEWSTRRMGVANANREAQLAIERLGDLPRGALFAYSTIALPMSAERDEAALATISDYHTRLNEHWGSQEFEERHPTVKYVGPEACYKCHSEQYEFWKSTQHSRAFATLAATSQHRDVECIGCHTVGFAKSRGFDHPAASAGFENVQCAACHGGGGPHMANPKRYFEPGFLTESGQQSCTGCHNDEHDPRFRGEAAERLAKVACPPTSPQGLQQPALRAAYREGAAAFEQDDVPDWERASELWMMAGEPERSLDAARSWSESDPRSIDVRVNLAEKLLLSGRLDEAIEQAEQVLETRPSHGRAWTTKTAALMAKPDSTAEALLAAREAYSIMPNDWTNARLLAEATNRSGDRMGAVDLLRGHLARQPADEQHLGALLAELLGRGD